MTYRPYTLSRLDDTPQLDAFARLRVSSPTLLAESKRVGSTPDLAMTTAVTGTGAVTYSANRASTMLTVGPAVGKATRQTKARCIYQPGKSLLLFQTFIAAPAQANLSQRIGYFSDKNGVFFSLTGTTWQVVRRSFVTGAAVDVAVDRANWNLDKLDGTGPSGKTLDITKPQILIIDFEWLGVGRVRLGFVIDGIPYYVHQFRNANGYDGLTAVYMTNPNLPIRWEAEATGAVTGTPGLESICASMNSEGGYDLNGITNAADSGMAAPRVIASGAHGELLSVRLQSAFTEFATAFAQSISAINVTGGQFRWRLVLNPTETVAGAWAAVTNSVMERNITRTVTVDTGTVIASGLVSAQVNAIDALVRPVLTLGTTIAGVTDVLSLQAYNLSAGNDDFYGAINWREVY